MAKKKRGAETVRDMVLTLGVIAALIALWMAVAPHSATPFQAVDYTGQLTDAREVAPYHVMAPLGLPPTWKANHAEYDGADPAQASWHLGFVTPENTYAGVDQSDGPSAPFLASLGVGTTAPSGTTEVNGVAWQRYPGSTTALVHTDGTVTTVVSGTADLQDLKTLAAALH